MRKRNEVSLWAATILLLASFAVHVCYAETIPGNKDFTGRVNLTGGVLIQETEVTATAAELNIMDGVTATAAEINTCDASATFGTGTSSSTVTTVISSVPRRVQESTVVDLTVVVDEGGTGTNGYGGTAFYTFPAGVVDVEWSLLQDVSCTGTGTLLVTSGGDVSIGTAVTAAGSLSGTAANLAPSLSVDPIGTEVAGTHLSAGAIFDGHTTPIVAYFNVNIDDGDIAATQTTKWSFVWSWCGHVVDY